MTGSTKASTGEVNKALASYISASASGPRAAMEAALAAVNFPALKAAAFRLYMAGRWSCSHPVNEVQLWEDLRDALGLKAGTATAAGIGAPPAPHGCPACDDAMECGCEPPLPMFGEPTAEDRDAAAAMLDAALKRSGAEL